LIDVEYDEATIAKQGVEMQYIVLLAVPLSNVSWLDTLSCYHYYELLVIISSTGAHGNSRHKAALYMHILMQMKHLTGCYMHSICIMKGVSYVTVNQKPQSMTRLFHF